MEYLTVLKADSTHADFAQLVRELDAYLSIRNGDADVFFQQFNKIDWLKNVVLIYDQDQAVGCGAFKPYDATTVEIKRMFTNLTHRGKGVARLTLSSLENWAVELGFTHAILETRKDMIDAVTLYESCGYTVMPNYAQYAGVESSVCFKKALVF